MSIRKVEHELVVHRVALVVHRRVARTSATVIVVKDYGVSALRPERLPVEATPAPTKGEAIRYVCAMDMVAGQLVAE